MDKIAYSKDCDGLAPAAPHQSDRAGTFELAAKPGQEVIDQADETADV